MTNNIITKYIGLSEVGTSLASEVLSADVDLSIYNYVDFVMSISSGTAATAVVKMLAKQDSESVGKSIAFREKLGDGVIYENIDINGKSVSVNGLKSLTYVFRVTNANLAKGEFTKVALSIDGISGTDLTCNITAVLYEPRYTD